ncbi:MAG: TRAP transporter large permease subunit [Acidobacteriota bacterium]
MRNLWIDSIAVWLALAAGETPKRLVALFRAVFGWAPGGVAVVAIFACAFFTSFTGGSGVTIVASTRSTGRLCPSSASERSPSSWSPTFHP